MEHERIDEDQGKQTINQIKALGAAIDKDPEPFTDWEKNFIADHLERIEKWGGETYFSPKQSAVIAKIHAERLLDAQQG